MNATRAATIRLRSSFDGAVSLGRVQTPTLAIVARREEEIRAFMPEPYWLVDARFEAVAGAPRRRYTGRYHKGAKPRLATAEEAEAIVAAARGGSLITQISVQLEARNNLCKVCESFGSASFAAARFFPQTHRRAPNVSGKTRS